MKRRDRVVLGVALAALLYLWATRRSIAETTTSDQGWDFAVSPDGQSWTYGNFEKGGGGW